MFKALDAARTKEIVSSAIHSQSKTIELNNMFHQSKDKFIETIAARIEKQLELYLDLRS